MDKFSKIAILENRHAFDPNQKAIVGSIETTKGAIAKLNNIIRSYVTDTYTEFGYKPYSEDIDININGVVLNSEYLNKMVNNYTIFNKFIRLKNFKTFDELFAFISTNLDKIYNYNGYYFKEIISILTRTIRLGNIGEQFALAAFSDAFLDKLGVNIVIESPTVEEDLRGVDGKFKYNNKDYTIQVKPMDSYNLYESECVIKTKGSLSLSADYLVTYRNPAYDLNTKKVIIVRNRGVVISGDTFTIPLASVVKIS
jgi:hypothetical protein